MESCPICHSPRLKDDKGSTPPYCPYCGYCLNLPSVAGNWDGRQQKPSPPAPSLGNYRIIHSIGKGGMGEVFLSYDPVCRRHVALKRIRPELKSREVLYHRFLREAWLTSQLTHPGVIAIYNIHATEQELYYTMPYVQGRTLKDILRQARLEEKRTTKPADPITTIPSLIRVFMSLAQIVAYAHSRGVLHRDLKPDNVMVGHFGEVYLLDWGLAKYAQEPDDEGSIPEGEEVVEIPQLTVPGKIFGTLSYLAPERVRGEPAAEVTDIYALGIILYQILSLRLPFKRTTVKEFRRNWQREGLVNPAKLAPYRNVPHVLARIARQCLAPNKTDRYPSVAALIRDLENYLEGRSDWFQITALNLKKKTDWEFQENVYLARDTAITGSAEVTEWVTMMVSRRSFPGNIKLTCRVRLGDEGSGVGLLLCIPERSERELPDTGYCLWLGNKSRSDSRLIRSSVEVLEAPEVSLKSNQWHTIVLEKIDNNLLFSLDGEQKLVYISHLPLAGTHMGVMYRDANFELTDLKVFVGSYSIKVNCLAIPDAFLANRDYNRALSEYRRIAYSFPERDEGREGKFRAGISLLEKAKNLPDSTLRESAYNLALEEFATLHETPGAPLEYLGKALVYQALNDNEEEVKCFQLAFRKYRHHPLLPVLEEQVGYRTHECSRKDRTAAYRFLLLIAQLLPTTWEQKATRRLFEGLQRHWEPLHFIMPLTLEEKRQLLRRHFAAVQLAFWLHSPYAIAEVISELATKKEGGSTVILNALWSLVELGSPAFAQTLLNNTPAIDATPLEPLLVCHKESLNSAIAAVERLPPRGQELRTYESLICWALRTDQPQAVHHLCQLLSKNRPPTPHEQIRIDSYQIWAYLLERQWDEAAAIFDHYPLDLINTENALLHPLYGCWLAVKEGPELAQIHFAGVLETPYPRSWALLGHFLTDATKRTDEWLSGAFLWEKRQLYNQLVLYYHCIGDEAKKQHFAALEHQQYVDVESD